MSKLGFVLIILGILITWYLITMVLIAGAVLKARPDCTTVVFSKYSLLNAEVEDCSVQQ